MRYTESTQVPEAMESYYQSITTLVDDFCEKHLNDEYRLLAHRAVAALCRKRPSPVVRGSTESWACAVLHALGMVNFLFDRTQTPHVRSSELAKAFEISQNTASSKSKQVRDLLGMDALHFSWVLPGRQESWDPLWMVQVNGLIVDIRTMPLELQKMALDKGLIPFIPALKNWAGVETAPPQ